MMNSNTLKDHHQPVRLALLTQLRSIVIILKIRIHFIFFFNVCTYLSVLIALSFESNHQHALLHDIAVVTVSLT